jgi:hypothetical protein
MVQSMDRVDIKELHNIWWMPQYIAAVSRIYPFCSHPMG